MEGILGFQVRERDLLEFTLEVHPQGIATLLWGISVKSQIGLNNNNNNKKPLLNTTVSYLAPNDFYLQVPIVLILHYLYNKLSVNHGETPYINKDEACGN